VIFITGIIFLLFIDIIYTMWQAIHINFIADNIYIDSYIFKKQYKYLTLSEKLDL
jgi:hypothetical protein